MEGQRVRRFEPRFAQAFLESALVALLFLVAVPLLLLLLVGVDSYLFSVGFGAAGAAFVLVFYLLRFLRRSSLFVEVGGEGIELAHRDGGVETLGWGEVREAVHENRYGLRWRLKLEGRSVTIRDDGLTTAEWDDMARRIRTRLAERGIPSKAEGLAQAFDEE